MSYALTPIGSEIDPLLADLMQWLDTRITHIADSQQEFDNGPATKVRVPRKLMGRHLAALVGAIVAGLKS